MTDVCLVLMPYAGIERPSLALGLLKACLTKNNIDAIVCYSNLQFASQIGLTTYKELADVYSGDFLGEWSFSQAAFPDFEANHAQYFDKILKKPTTVTKALLKIRQQATLFVDKVAQSILKLNPKIVSCSSTFYQHCASLALLRRIRELAPEIITTMGGANCEGPMGLANLRSFHWIDFICSGESDETYVKLCRKLLEKGRDLSLTELPYGVLGVTHRHSPITPDKAPRSSVEDLDHIPIPDFDDYFHTLQNSALSSYIYPGLFVETSRGCWWGQKQHCTFCGLNGQGMTYRSKSPQRVVSELNTLSERYQIKKFFVVDNILDPRHITTVLPMFANLEQPYTLFYETKANLNRQQVQQLAQAGVLWMQPGIESMHDEALKLMKKGNTALMNVQLLKWGREFGIQVLWNFLVGMPGESLEWYSETLEWLPLTVHLQPPTGMRFIRYDRFSPYHEQPQNYGLKLVPNKAYTYIYPVSSETLEDLAYFFEEQTQKDFQEPEKYLEHQALEAYLNEWKSLFFAEQPPTLRVVEDDGKQMTILDTRPCATSEEHILQGVSYWVYRECDRVMNSEELSKLLNRKYQLEISSDELESVVDQLYQCKILLRIKDKFLSLALKGSLPPLMKSEEQPGGHADVERYLEDVRKQFWDMFTNKV